MATERVTTDRIGKLLERVARDADIAWRDDAEDTPRAELFQRVLEAQVGPLLRAGQAMREWRLGNRKTIGLQAGRKAWDEALAALATLEGRDGK